MEERRWVARLVLLNKIKEVAVSPEVPGLYKNQRALRGLGTRDKLLAPSRNTTAEKKAHFVAKTVPEWNQLLEHTKTADSVQSFKSLSRGVSLP